MVTTEKTKARFKVRIFDLKDDKNTSFQVYDDDESMTLAEFKKRLRRLSGTGDKN